MREAFPLHDVIMLPFHVLQNGGSEEPEVVYGPWDVQGQGQWEWFSLITWLSQGERFQSTFQNISNPHHNLRTFLGWRLWPPEEKSSQQLSILTDATYKVFNTTKKTPKYIYKRWVHFEKKRSCCEFQVILHVYRKPRKMKMHNFMFILYSNHFFSIQNVPV